MRISLRGLEVCSAQVWGAVRLVPLVRTTPIDDLRLALRNYGPTVADLGKRTVYTSYVPHGIVMRWSEEGEAAEIPVETRIGRKETRQRGLFRLKRMVRKEARDQLRMLPLHTAMEGFLSLHFGGPDIAHRCWSSQVLKHGLSPRTEFVGRGRQIAGLEEALALFEVHDGQCGVMVFVADQLASVMVVSHPEDYLALHRGLIEDFFGELLVRWGWAFRHVPQFGVTLDGDDLDAIAASLAHERADWARFTAEMAGGVFEREMVGEALRKAGRFRLHRFRSEGGDTIIDGEHLGEVMLTPEGEVAYLKTYRMDRGQVRRAHMLTALSRAQWSIQSLANEEGHGNPRRIEQDLITAGLGWMLSGSREL